MTYTFYVPSVKKYLRSPCFPRFDIVFYLRLNKRWGINDHCFVIGSSAIQTVLGTWLWMPSTVRRSMLPLGPSASSMDGGGKTEQTLF